MRLKIRFNRSEPGFWISGAAHLAMLGTAIFAYSSPTFPEAEEGIPVEIITDNQFSEITRGETQARQVQPNAKPRVDRVAETRQERDPGEAPKDAPAPPRRPAEVKVDDREVEAAAAPPPPPLPPRPDREAEARREETARAEKAAAEAQAKERAEAQAQAQAERAEKAKAEADAKAKAVADAQAKAEADAKAKAVAEAKAEAEAIEQAKAEAEAKAKAAAEARRVAEAKAKAEAQSKAAADAKAKAEAEAKAVAEAKAKAEADAKAKELAEAKAKAEAEAKRVAAAKAEAEAKARRQAELADKFSPGDIRQLLQSKDKSQSSGSTGSEVNKTASLGTATGMAQRLNPSMRDALGGIIREQIERCYTAPIGASGGTVTMPLLDIRFNPDGTLAGEPRILRAGSTALDRTVAEAALRAVRRCAPYRIPAQFAPYYDAWKHWNVEFEFGLT